MGAAPRHVIGPVSHDRHTQPSISARRGVTDPGAAPTRTYARRHAIENVFGRIGQFRAIIPRCEQTAWNVLAASHVVASVVRLD